MSNNALSDRINFCNRNKSQIKLLLMRTFFSTKHMNFEGIVPTINQSNDFIIHERELKKVNPLQLSHVRDGIFKYPAGWPKHSILTLNGFRGVFAVSCVCSLVSTSLFCKSNQTAVTIDMNSVVQSCYLKTIRSQLVAVRVNAREKQGLHLVVTKFVGWLLRRQKCLGRIKTVKRKS